MRSIILETMPKPLPVGNFPMKKCQLSGREDLNSLFYYYYPVTCGHQGPHPPHHEATVDTSSIRPTFATVNTDCWPEPPDQPDDDILACSVRHKRSIRFKVTCICSVKQEKTQPLTITNHPFRQTPMPH